MIHKFYNEYGKRFAKISDVFNKDGTFVMDAEEQIKIKKCGNKKILLIIGK